MRGRQLHTITVDVNSINKEWGQQGNHTACEEMEPAILLMLAILALSPEISYSSEIKKALVVREFRKREGSFMSRVGIIYSLQGKYF